MAGRKNRGMRRLIYDRARETGCSPFDAIDQIIDEMRSFRLPGEDPEPEPVIRNGKRWGEEWRLPRAERPRCGAQTRKGTPCKREALKNGRCPNHGGLSTGPKSPDGRARIAAAQRTRWQAYRAAKLGKV